MQNKQQNQSKDFIKFRQYLRSKDLKVNEQYLLELLFEYHNIEYGYAFPKFSDIMSAFNTTSKNRISSTIKKLEKKGLIRVERTFANNRYYVIGIEDFINSNDINKPKQKPKDSNGNTPLNGQVHIEELEEVTEDEKQLMELSNMKQKQAKSLLQMAKNKISKVIGYVNYALKRGIKNVYAYVRKLIKVNANVIKCEENSSHQYKKPIPFLTSCEGRNYSNEWYEDIEKKLLGWG